MIDYHASMPSTEPSSAGRAGSWPTSKDSPGYSLDERHHHRGQVDPAAVQPEVVEVIAESPRSAAHLEYPPARSLAEPPLRPRRGR